MRNPLFTLIVSGLVLCAILVLPTGAAAIATARPKLNDSLVNLQKTGVVPFCERPQMKTEKRAIKRKN